MRTMSQIAAIATVGCVLLVSCGSKEAAERAQSQSNLKQYGLASADAPSEEPAAAGESKGAGETLVNSATANRKIIYSATVELAVEDFAGVPAKVAALVKQFDAYIASSNQSGSTGSNRSGTWRIRVPVTRFDEFVIAAKGLGELINVGTSSQDVSEEYYDVEARIRNKTKEEERLLALLEDRPGKLEDVIAIERELSRVREELERMQGRMRVLADQTTLTTVDLTITEIRNYEPAESPALGTRIRRSFSSSLGALQTAGENLVIAAAALLPWIPILGLAIALLYAFVRWLNKLSSEGESSKPREANPLASGANENG